MHNLLILAMMPTGLGRARSFKYLL